MNKILNTQIPFLISPLILKTKLAENGFSQKFRLLEANFGLSSLEDFNK